jgi:hypothetical protein
MPSDSSDYTAAEGYTDKAQRNNLAAAPFHDFEQLNTAQSAEVSRAFGLIESYTNLMFAPISETPTSHAAIRLADSSSPPTSFSEDPQKDLPVSGDVFYGAAARDPTIGSLSSAPILHEIGHALGLNHGDPGNSNGPFGPIGAQYDDIEYSVMNYAAFIGAPITDPLGADAAAQSYMMYDIAALQYYYGANFGNVGKNFTYSWNRSTGQEFINGQGQGEPLIDTVFETVWTGGATSTYDLSNYNDDAWLDMRPGQFMKFSNGQLNELGLKDDAVPEYAQGNVYNALLFNGDTRSEINNVITGNGSDIVIGNDVFNIITLGNGNDSVLIGGAGARVFGGTGNDTIVPSAAPSEIHGGGGWNKLDYSWEKDPITINVQNGAAVKPDWPFEPVIDEFTNIQSFFGGAGNDTFISGKGHFDFDGGGGSNKLDYSWDSAGITVDLSIGQVDKGNQGSGTIILARWQGTDEVKNIQSFVGGSGNNTFISAAGSFMFDGSTGKSTLDYSWDQADLRVELSHDPLAPQGGTVDKGWVTTVPIWTPGVGGGFVLHTWQGSDTFDNVQSFVGGSGKNTFISAAGSFNFNGGTGTSTLDYSWDQGTVTVDLLHGTVDKGVAGGSWQGADRFTNIQNFIGGSGGIKFLINHYGSFSFNGSTSGSSTFDYSGDTSSQFGLVVDARAGTAVKTVPTVGSVGSYLTSSTDTFSNIQQFVGGAGHNTFMDTTGLYTFDGGGGVTTLDESWDQADLSINLELGTIDKGWVAATSGFFPINWQGQDTIINVQNFIGGAGNDSIVDARTISGLPAATGSHSFNGGGGINTAYFHGAHTEYTIATALGSDGQLHTTVVDNGSAGDGPIDLVNVQHLQFTDGLYDRALTGGLSDRAPVVIVDGWTPSLGRSFAASSLFTAVDPDGDPITNYAFWNSGVGGGHFVLNGSAEPVNKEVDITAAQLAQLSYQSGSGGDTLWVKASDGSKWSAWSPGFTVDAPIDPGPVITAANTMLSKGQTTITASSLFTATDPLSLPITKYAFWDSGTAGGRFVLNGVAQGTNQEIDVTAAQLSQLIYQAGSAPDTLWVCANDGYVWGAWSKPIGITAFIDSPPVVTGSNLTAAHGQSFAAASLFTGSDADADSIATYAFWNSGAGGGHFVLNGVAQGTNQEIDVTAGQLSQLSYQSGSGADTLWVKAYDGTQWSSWSSAFTVMAPIDQAPVATGLNVAAAHGQSFTASSLFTATDADGDNISKYAVWNSGTGGGHFVLNGVVQGTSQEIDVTAAQLSQLSYQSGSGADTLWVKAYDGIQWSSWSSAFTVTAPIDQAPVATGSNVTAAHGQSFAASSLFTATDADGDTITKYAFWNSGTGGGHFVLNGVAQGTSQEIDVSASQLSQLSYQSGSGADTLWVRANDGILWGNWPNGFTVTAPIDSGPTVTPTNASIKSFPNQTFAASSLISYSDPFNSPATQYDFWNSGADGGHFVLNGNALPTGQDNIISAGQSVAAHLSGRHRLGHAVGARERRNRMGRLVKELHHLRPARRCCRRDDYARLGLCGRGQFPGRYGHAQARGLIELCRHRGRPPGPGCDRSGRHRLRRGLDTWLFGQRR